MKRVLIQTCAVVDIEQNENGDWVVVQASHPEKDVLTEHLRNTANVVTTEDGKLLDGKTFERPSF